MAGYATRLITLRFDQWSEDPENDPIWISIRNPKLMPAGEFSGSKIELDASGQPVNNQDALRVTFEMCSKVVVAWRVYDATATGVDEVTGEPVDQPLLGLPATPDLCAKLPTEFLTAISKEIMAAINPQ